VEVRGMTWEEISKKYEQDTRGTKTAERIPKLDKGWDELVRSTDKLIWLFSLSGGRKQPRSS
jgi:hypothetical protein